MARYRKIPVEIEAEQWFEPDSWGNAFPCMDTREEFKKSVTWFDKGIANVHTIHNNQTVKIEAGDYIIPEPDGIHYYPCKEDIFLRTYERIES